jgi:hypothetical protein
MIKKFIIPAIPFILFTACKQSFKQPEDAQDAGREFIRASLDGNYEKASFYLYPDSTNKMLFAKWKQDHEHLDHEEQKKYRDADILPINIRAINDSVTSYTYANSYKKDTTTIRIIRIDGQWLVDLKEILNGKQ